jgi:hypothetical protein
MKMEDRGPLKGGLGDAVHAVLWANCRNILLLLIPDSSNTTYDGHPINLRAIQHSLFSHLKEKMTQHYKNQKSKRGQPRI